MRSNPWLVLSSVILAFTPVVVDMTVLHVAIPTLTLALGASGNEVLWIIDVYPLVMAGMLVPMGTLADRIGYRRMLLIGLAVFGAASVVAAFSTTTATLIAARAALGIGSSMIMPCILAVIRQTFEDDAQRANALGVWSVVGMAGAAIGPLVGGVLLEHFWWGSVFLINVPIMIVVIPLVWLLVPATPGNNEAVWRPGQAVLFIAGLILTVYGIKSGFKMMPSIFCLIPLLAGVGFLTWFASIQMSSDDPMLDLSLLSKPVIGVGLLMAFVASASLAGFELVLAQELQFVLGKTPLEAGVFMLPLVIAAAVGGPLGSRLATRFGLRIVASLSMASAAFSLLAIAFCDLAQDTYIVAGFLAILGLALGIGLLASSIAIMGGAPKEKAGAAGALESSGYELGGGLGVTLFGVLVNSIYRSSFSDPSMAMDGAWNSIGEAMTVARAVGGARGVEIAAAAQAAFGTAHGSVLMLAGIMIALLSVAIFISLRETSPEHEHSQG